MSVTHATRITVVLALVVSAKALATPTWWFQDPNFYGDRNVGTYSVIGGQPSYTWYDDDVPWSTGSVVRLPEDAYYVGDVLTCVACYGGGSDTMHSPYFKGADGKVFFFNHLETRYLGGAGWYNGGAVIGLTGGGTCQTGYGTFCGTSNPVSTGPHFCIETANQHAYIDFPTNYTPTSDCSNSDGTSGMANVLCSGSAQCAQYTCGSTYYWTCQSDGKLHECDAAGNPITVDCVAGCHSTGTCTNDVCNIPASCSQWSCANGNYYWTCQSDGDLHECDSAGNPVVTKCPYGCHTTGTCTDDVCNSAPPPDAGGEKDAGTHSDSGIREDAGETRPDAGKTEGADANRAAADATVVDDGGTEVFEAHGCGYSAGLDGASGFAAVGLALAWFGRRRRGTAARSR
jgi:hypothetical protein